jgi:NADPH-dependent curcumin reductase CurA
MATKNNRQWRLVGGPVGLIKGSDFKLTEEPVSDPREGQVLVRNLYLSLDPANRGWASRDSYVPAVTIDEVMRGNAVGSIVGQIGG